MRGNVGEGPHESGKGDPKSHQKRLVKNQKQEGETMKRGVAQGSHRYAKSNVTVSGKHGEGLSRTFLEGSDRQGEGVGKKKGASFEWKRRSL